jgi:hypothetical protein
VLATYILGPFAALLPRRWRKKVFPSAPAQMSRVAMLSGILEAVLAMAGLVLWYSIYVTLASDAIGRSTAPGGSSRIGMFAYIWFWLNPITWFVSYFVFEGAVRYLAALTAGEACGSLPLCFADWVWRHARPRSAKLDPPLVADEMVPGDAAGDIKIASCRAKPDWQYPFTIRYAGAYFQVFASVHLGAGPRPHVYSLRRLRPGEVARGLKEYKPDDILTTVAPLEPVEK